MVPASDKASPPITGARESLTGAQSSTMPSVRSFEVMSIASGTGEDELLLGPGGDAGGVLERVGGVKTERLRTMVALNAASILEKSDEQLLPSVYKYVGCSLKHATPGMVL